MAASLVEKIRAAWRVLPYRGDHVLSDCWCEECEYSVRSLRGKSWKQITRVLLEFMQWIDTKGEQCPMVLDAVRRCVSDREVEVVPYTAVMRWLMSKN